VLWSANNARRVGRDDLAKHKPVEEHPNGGQVLLDGRFRVRFGQILDVGCGSDRFDQNQRKMAPLTPCTELADGARVGGTGVLVADIGGEELESEGLSFGKLSLQNPAGAIFLRRSIPGYPPKRARNRFCAVNTLRARGPWSPTDRPR
jgi:hypothetical protein